MAFDGIFLHHMTAEISEILKGGRIQKINQPFEQELLLTVQEEHHINYYYLLIQLSAESKSLRQTSKILKILIILS